MPKTSSFFLGTVIILAFALLIVYGIVSWPEGETENTSEVTPKTNEIQTLPRADFGNPFIGPKDAPLTIFVYSDYECSACAQLEPNLIEVITTYPDKIRLVWKDLPDERLHVNAVNAAVAGRCADQQGGFWPFHDLLITNQTSLDETNFQIFAEQVGLNVKDFIDCYLYRNTEPLVRRDIEEAQKLGIDATPYLFIGKTRLSGAVSTERLRITIDSELSRLNVVQ